MRWAAMTVEQWAAAWPPEKANCPQGYIRTNKGGSVKYLHRLIWEHFHGEIPDGMQIDHINGIRTDNRLENLRLVSPAQNGRNMRRRGANTSGVCGVYFKVIGKYRYWACSWYAADGRHCGKGFNVAKYGDAEARRSAEEYRAARIAEIGDYTERHGHAIADDGEQVP